MNNRKGFTLVELLAVIAILAILVILALPNVMNMYVRAKKNTFLMEAQNMLKESTNKFIQDGISGTKTKTISNDKNPLNLTGEKLKYNVKLDNKGNITDYTISNGNYCISSKKSFDKLTIDDISDKCSYEELNKIAGTLIKDFYEKSGRTDRGLVSSIVFYSDGRKIDSLEKYDVSEEQDNSIVMYLNTSVEDSSLLDLTIVSNGKIMLPSDSSNLFSFWTRGGCGSISRLNNIKFNSSIDTSKVTNMSYMFYSIHAQELDLSSFNTSNVTDMSYMFYLSDATILDLSNFDTSNVIDMSYMFYLSDATTFDLSNFDTSNVTNMSYMFYGSQATTLDLSNFDTSNVTNMSSMFYGSQATTLDLSNFDTSNVTSMGNIFQYSAATTIVVSKLNTSKVTNMNHMFYGSKVTTLDLSGFDTSNVTDMYQMFYSCSNLKTIYVSDKFNTDKATNSYNMFRGVTKLVGGAGTIYDSTKTDKTYARIDGGSSNPGYFTKK